MRRPTERPLPGVIELTDADAPDFLEGHRVALLAFLDLRSEASIRLRGRLNLLAARHLRVHDLRALGVGVIAIEGEPLVAEALGVRQTPEIVLFVLGEVADRVSGVPPESILDEMIVGCLKRAAP